MANKTVSQLIESDGPGYDDIIEISQVSRTITLSAATISAQASDNSFNDSGSGFIAAGFSTGDHVKVAGFTGDTVNNITTGEITDLAAGKMTIGGSDGDVIVDDAAGEVVTISRWVTRRAPRFGRVLLQEISLTSAGEFDFDDIPQGFNRVFVMGSVRSNYAGGSFDAALLSFNNDSNNSNYYQQELVGNNGGFSGAETAGRRLGAVPTAACPSGAYAPLCLRVEEYSGAWLKTAISESLSYRVADAQITSGKIYITHDTLTSALTRIKIAGESGSLLGVLRLYGEL